MTLYNIKIHIYNNVATIHATKGNLCECLAEAVQYTEILPIDYLEQIGLAGFIKPMRSDIISDYKKRAMFL
jgi:hypothetical protein